MWQPFPVFLPGYPLSAPSYFTSINTADFVPTSWSGPLHGGHCLWIPCRPGLLVFISRNKMKLRKCWKVGVGVLKSAALPLLEVSTSPALGRHRLSEAADFASSERELGLYGRSKTSTKMPSLMDRLLPLIILTRKL